APSMAGPAAPRLRPGGDSGGAGRRGALRGQGNLDPRVDSDLDLKLSLDLPLDSDHDPDLKLDPPLDLDLKLSLDLFPAAPPPRGHLPLHPGQLHRRAAAPARAGPRNSDRAAARPVDPAPPGTRRDFVAARTPVGSAGAPRLAVRRLGLVRELLPGLRRGLGPLARLGALRRLWPGGRSHRRDRARARRLVGAAGASRAGARPLQSRLRRRPA